ncbi:MAG: PAS domain-containing protein [Desulfobulbaceae bacterium]|nr:MAG: PAS domain-containing protein [Desulfobulbaceae bacterium]
MNYLKDLHTPTLHARQIHRAKVEWENTVDALPDAISIIDKNYRVIRLNKTMLGKLGASSYHEVIGSKCHFCVHSSDSPPEFCPHTKLLKDDQEHRVEIYNEQFGGHCEIIVTPYKDLSNETLGSIHIIRDINQQKQDEKEREKLIARNFQSQKLESVGQLAAGIAHEINTPSQFIGSNIGFIEESFQTLMELLLSIINKANHSEGELKNTLLTEIENADWDYLAEEIPLAIEQSKEGLTRISSIVKAIKDFSHPGGKLMKPASINAIINTTIAVAKNEWKYAANVKTDLDPNLPKIPCFANDIGQVFLNLLVNAVHAIEDKIGKNPTGQKGTITFTTTHTDHEIEIRVSDTGNGIPAYVQSRIFDPFFTTKNVGEGTGQGLSISHDIITKEHHGIIDFITKANEGTEFIIRLPFSL